MNIPGCVTAVSEFVDNVTVSQEQLPTDCEEFADDDEGIIQWLHQPIEKFHIRWPQSIHDARSRLDAIKKADLHQLVVDREDDVVGETCAGPASDYIDRLEHELRVALLCTQARKHTISVASDSDMLEPPARKGDNYFWTQHASVEVNSDKLHVSQSSLGTTCCDSGSTSSSDTDCMLSASGWSHDENVDQTVNVDEQAHFATKCLTEPALAPTGKLYNGVNGVPYLATVSRFQLRKSWSAHDLTANLCGSGGEAAGLSTSISKAPVWTPRSHNEQEYLSCTFGCSTCKLMKPSCSLEKSMCIQKERVRALEDDFKNMLEKIKSEGLVLSEQVEELAVDAFDCACQRTVPGAMEVFEDTGSELTRISRLLQKCELASSL